MECRRSIQSRIISIKTTDRISFKGLTIIYIKVYEGRGSLRNLTSHTKIFVFPYKKKLTRRGEGVEKSWNFTYAVNRQAPKEVLPDSICIWMNFLANFWGKWRERTSKKILVGFWQNNRARVSDGILEDRRKKDWKVQRLRHWTVLVVREN